LLLGDEDVRGLGFELGNDLEPVVRWRELHRPGVRASRCAAGEVDEDDGPALLTERSREVPCPFDDGRRRVHRRKGEKSSLQIDDDEGGLRVEHLTGKPPRTFSAFARDRAAAFLPARD
jgi:hypothetical protein